MECCSLYNWHVSVNGGSCYAIHQETTASWRHLGQVATGSTGTCRDLPGSKTVSTFLAREPVVVKLETNGRACPTPATASSTAGRRSITSTKDSFSSSSASPSSHEPPKCPQREIWNHPALASTILKSRNGIHVLSRCKRVSSGSSAIDSNEIMTVSAVKTAKGRRSWRSQHPWPHQRPAHALTLRSVSAQSAISETPLGYTARRTSSRRQHDVSRRAVATSIADSRCLGGSWLSHPTPRIMMRLPGGEDILKGALRREGRTQDGYANPIGFPIFLLGNSRRLAGHLCRGTGKRTRKVRAGEEVVDTEDVDRLREEEGEEQRADDAGKQAKRSSDGGKLSGQSSWDAKNAQGEDYLYRLGKEADNLNITVGARAGVIDDLFVGGFLGKDADIVFKYRQQVTRKFEHIQGDYYIAPKFMDKVVVHIGKNYLADQIDARVPLILGIWGGKGQGKTFQTELIFKAIGIEPVILSAGELESERAGEPGRLIRDRYRAASAVVKNKGVMSCLMINDLDAGVGRFGNTQFTVNNQIVIGTLMNLCDNPHSVSVGQSWREDDILARVPIIVTGNDLSTLYAPLIRDGRMEKFYWAPTREDLIEIVHQMYKKDNLSKEDISKLIDLFPGQALDFYGALHSRTYDDQVKKWVEEIGGPENVVQNLMKRGEPRPTVTVPQVSLKALIHAGNELVAEQQKVAEMKLSDEYMKKQTGPGVGLSFS